MIKVNPCDESTLLGITYTSDGVIKSSDPMIDEDLNQRLNLNGEYSSLVENRKQVLESLIFDVRNVVMAIYHCIAEGDWIRFWKWMIQKYHM